MLLRLFLIFALVNPAAPMAEDMTGSASYRDRIAMQAGSRFRASLVDLSATDPVEIASFDSAGRAGPPYLFAIPFDPDRLPKAGVFALRVEVTVDGLAFFTGGGLLKDFPATSYLVEDIVMHRAVDGVQAPLNKTLR